MAKAPYLLTDQPTQQSINAAAAPAPSGLDPELFRQLAANRAQAVQQQQGGIAQQEQMLKDHLARAGNQQMDLTPLLSFADQMSGWNTAKSYNRPTSAMGNMQMTADLQGALQKAKGALTDDEQQYLMSLLSTNQKADSANLAAQTGMYKADQMGDVAQAKLAVEQAKKGGLSLTPLQLQADKDFAPLLVNWNVGGKDAVDKNLKKMEDVKTQLQKAQDDWTISGRLVGVTPDWARSATSKQIQQDIQGSILGVLRETLGAQFTEKEGARIMAVSYDPSLPPAENIKKVEAGLLELIAKKNNMNALANEAIKSGTLKDYAPVAAPQAVAPQQAAVPTSGGMSREQKIKMLQERDAGGGA